MANTNLDNIDLSEYPHINKGLEGIVAFSTSKSFIDGQKGELIYAGYNIDTLAENATFEEVCFLLWNDRLPNKNELDELKNKMVAQRELPKPVLTYIKSTSKDAEPMAVLRSAVSMLADFQDNTSNTDSAIAIAAQMPTIVAAFARARDGKKLLRHSIAAARPLIFCTCSMMKSLARKRK